MGVPIGYYWKVSKNFCFAQVLPAWLATHWQMVVGGVLLLLLLLLLTISWACGRFTFLTIGAAILLTTSGLPNNFQWSQIIVAIRNILPGSWL